jgi:ElaB/YqjD/DUF883 family membrane-anchored ribosome-binding protein
MDQQTLLYVMTGFVVVSAIAMIIQAAMLAGIYKASQATQLKVTLLLPKVESLLDSSQKALENSKTQIVDVTSKASEILDMTRAQLARVDEMLTDAGTRAKVQLDRAELVLDDTLSRAQETVAMVHGGVVRPVREIQGVAAGVRTALAYLVRGGRPNVAEATHDEEMFI